MNPTDEAQEARHERLLLGSTGMHHDYGDISQNSDPLPEGRN